jgi:hypothetical protein
VPSDAEDRHTAVEVTAARTEVAGKWFDDELRCRGTATARL